MDSKADLRDVLLFLGVRAADYTTALLLYRCSEVFFLRHELNRTLVAALQTGSFLDIAVREALWFSVVVGGWRVSPVLSGWLGERVSRVLVEVFSHAFLLSLGASLCGVTGNVLCVTYVLLGMRHPLEYGFKPDPPRLGETILAPFLSFLGG